MALLGMRGSGTYNAAERPKNWRQGILLLFPNGEAPLTAILSKLREQPTDDPQFSWFEKGLPEQQAMIAGASTALGGQPVAGSDIAAAGADGQIALNVRPRAGASFPTTDTTIFKAGHVLYNQTTDELFFVIRKGGSGTGAWLEVIRDYGAKFSTNPAVTGDATAGDTIIIVGSGFPEGAGIGESIAYAPVFHWNVTQIFRTALFLTRTGRKTKLRWDASGAYAEAKREALQLHALEMERAFLFSERSTSTAISGAAPDSPLGAIGTATPLRTTRGLLSWLPAITSGASPTVHWDVNLANSGVLTEALWDSFLEEAFRYGSREKLGLCGSTFLNVMTQLTKNKATIEMVPTDQTYGMHMMRYLTPFGTLMLVNHPLMSHDSVFRKDLFVVDVDKLTYRYLDDTRFLRNRQAPGDDASKDEWLTEAGLEVHFGGVPPANDPDGLSSPSSIETQPAHGRLKGVASYGG
jgi:hypothetical protein